MFPRTMVVSWPLLAVLALQAIAAPFTPEKLITAPRPSSSFQLSPDQKQYAVGVSYAHYDGTKTSSSVYVYPVPKAGADDDDSKPRAQAVLPGISYAAWLDPRTLIYVNGSDLFVSSHLREAQHKQQKIAHLPAPITTDSLKVVNAPDNRKRLVFAAEVYDDGTLEGVNKVETDAYTEEWNRVKAYDGDNGALYRHWDVWNKPGKRSQLFTTILFYDHGEEQWHYDGKFNNLLKHTKFITPIPPFGDNQDWDVNEDGLVFNAKALDLPQAWHTRTEIHHVSFHDGKITKLSVQDTHGALSSPVFSPDGDKVAWLQMAIDGHESDQRVLQVFDIQSGHQQALLTKWDRSPSAISYSHDGKKIFLVTEDHQRDKVYVTDVKSSADKPDLALSLRDGSVSQFVPLRDGDRALFTASSLRHPSEVYLHSHHSGTNYPLTWFTGSANSSLRDVEWGSHPPKEFHYPAPDREGEVRWGWIHYPRDYESRTDWPVAILIHGGPEGAWTDSWSTRWNPEVFAGAGYLVATLNPTGSTGFGQAYQDRILNNWGGEPYRDIIAGVKHVLKREEKHIDKEKVAAAGASYGGYMINWIQGHNPSSLFKALITHDGVFSTFSTFYSTDEVWFPEREFGPAPGLPWNLTSRATYARWSPEHHVGNWNTPHLVIHGDKDFRLTPDQGISVFNALRRRGVQTRLVYFENEGHWVLDPKSSRKWHHEVIGWFDRWIGQASEGGTKSESVRKGEYVQL